MRNASEDFYHTASVQNDSHLNDSRGQLRNLNYDHTKRPEMRSYWPSYSQRLDEKQLQREKERERGEERQREKAQHNR